MAGTVTTAAYDISRWLLIEWTDIAFWPFDIFMIFGQALFSTSLTGTWIVISGFVFHLVNGVGFAVAYAFAFGKKGAWAGIAWAMALEVAMISIYPGWLDIRAKNEFLQVSVFGHLVYGAVLGASSNALIRHLERPLS